MVDLLTREYEVNYSHIDNRGIAKPSFLWNIMQDAATVHAEALAHRSARSADRVGALAYKSAADTSAAAV